MFQIGSWSRTSIPFQRLVGVVKDARRKCLRHGAQVVCLDASMQSDETRNKLARLAALNR